MKLHIAGFGSVTPFGTIAGRIPTALQSSLDLREITSWPTAAPRRAFLVPPFQPSSVIPGLKTRRLDRISAWALVAASLALQDSGIDLAQMDRSRIAVVFATGFGCIELTEAFYQSAHKNGWAGTDPITFPETLANSPAGHVAMFHDLRGPNITVSCKHFAAESALLQAASLLRLDQADLAIVIAGDNLTQAMYEWYDTAGLLSPATRDQMPSADATGLLPSEGVVALVLAPDGREGNRESNPPSYARLVRGKWTAAADPIEGVRTFLDNATPDVVISAGDGTPCDPAAAPSSVAQIIAPNTPFIPPQPVALGIPDAGALLHLLLALSATPNMPTDTPTTGHALMLSTTATSGYASLLFELS